MTTHIILVVAFFLLVAAAAWLYPKVKDLLSPTQPSEPGDDDREASGDPVEHEGATEDYGDKLRAMRKVENSPDLIRPAEQMVADHEALHAITVALDDFDRTVSDAISRFLRNQPTVLLRLPSSIEHTGEMPVVELAVA